MAVSGKVDHVRNRAKSDMDERGPSVETLGL